MKVKVPSSLALVVIGLCCGGAWTSARALAPAAAAAAAGSSAAATPSPAAPASSAAPAAGNGAAPQPFARATEPGGQAGCDGLWNGLIYFKRGDVELEMVAEIARAAGGEWVGTLDIPSQGLLYLTLEDVKVEGPNVSFGFSRLSRTRGMTHSSFKGAVAPDGKTIRGEFREEETGPYPFVLVRQGEAGSERKTLQQRSLAELSDDFSQLKTAFNRDRGKVRLVVLLSPVCPVCLMHARVIWRDLMQEIASDQVRLYLVWGPMLGEEKEADAHAATVNLPDPRVTHFWIPDDTLAKAFARPLGWTNLLAWNTFMIFQPAAAWSEEPPRPDVLMAYEKPLPAEQLFNGEKLAQQVRRFLGSR